MTPRTQSRLSGPLMGCLELLREGPSSVVWTFCKTSTIDACERRGLIRDTGRRDQAILRIFELTKAGISALAPISEGREQTLWG